MDIEVWSKQMDEELQVFYLVIHHHHVGLVGD